MSKAGTNILTGLEDALAYAQGKATDGKAHCRRAPGAVDVKTIRKWEQGSQALENTSDLRTLRAK